MERPATLPSPCPSSCRVPATWPSLQPLCEQKAVPRTRGHGMHLNTSPPPCGTPLWDCFLPETQLRGWAGLQTPSSPGASQDSWLEAPGAPNSGTHLGIP